jgi:hypothetical protein
MELIAKGQNNRQENAPARWNLYVALAATKILSIKAAGFIIAEVTPTKPIAAMYPEAPANPTDE